jgi:UDP-2-acetamido-2-deoxy-ribo-hexuluronate aminotransferase
MKVRYYKVGEEFNRIKNQYNNKIKVIFNSGNFILGKSNIKFEKKISDLLKIKYVCGVGNGSDALELAMLAMGIKKGDEVITATNSWVSSVNSIINIGAKPVLVDVKDDFNIDYDQIKKAITKKTKAIMPVHLNGLPSSMKEICKIAKKNKLKIIEDSAQAILSKYGNKYVGTIGDVGCFSMHPTKNLGVAGDGGFVVTNNKKIHKKIKIIANHGVNNKGDLVMVGRNSRLDEIQAEFILHRIKYLKKDIKRIIEIAKLYNSSLKKFVKIPKIYLKNKLIHTYHRYVITLKNKVERDLLKKFLEKNQIECKIHYPKPIHKYRCFSKYSFTKKLKISEDQSNKILSLPCNHFMSEKEVKFVVKKIKQYFLK